MGYCCSPMAWGAFTVCLKIIFCHLNECPKSIYQVQNDVKILRVQSLGGVMQYPVQLLAYSGKCSGITKDLCLCATITTLYKDILPCRSANSIAISVKVLYCYSISLLVSTITIPSTINILSLSIFIEVEQSQSKPLTLGDGRKTLTGDLIWWWPLCT